MLWCHTSLDRVLTAGPVTCTRLSPARLCACSTLTPSHLLYPEQIIQHPPVFPFCRFLATGFTFASACLAPQQILLVTCLRNWCSLVYQRETLSRCVWHTGEIDLFVPENKRINAECKPVSHVHLVIPGSRKSCGHETDVQEKLTQRRRQEKSVCLSQKIPSFSTAQ